MKGVSVVIPAYNACRYLDATLDAILSQDPMPDEVMVVDDGSQDRTADTAERRGVTVLRRAHEGASAAINAGVRASTSPFLAFCDADDLWPAGRLRALREALNAHVEASGVYGATENFLSPELSPSQRERLQRNAGRFDGACLGALLVRRDVFNRVGFFDESVRFGAFVDWWLRAQSHGVRMVALPSVVLLRRVHGANSGLTDRESRRDYLTVLRGAIRRRRGEL